MLRLEHSKPVKTISTIVLAFFLWSFGGVFDIAYAFKGSDQPSAVSNQPQKPNGKKPEEKFEEALEKIREAEERTHKKLQKGEDTEKEETEVRIQKTEIEKHDIEIKKQFKETEDKIKSLPEEIKKRHTDFVKKYEDNLNELKTNLDDIEKAKTKEGKRLAHKKTKEFLEKTKPPKKHKPLDPNKLPHRTAEPVSPILLESNTSSINKTEALSFNGLLKTLGDLLIPSVYAAESPNDPNLSETVEITLTPEIIDLANSLGGTPVDLYEYVRNVFKYEPYAGSVKDAAQTLQEKAGNEWDLASLLVALFRAKGMPARYVLGTVEMPIEKAMSWLGVADPNMVGTMLASNGKPTALITNGGKITALEIQHVWVQVYIPFLPSRGTVSGPGDTWVNIDASFKAHNISQTLTVSETPFFNQENYLSTFQADSPYDYYHNQLQDFLNANAAGYIPEALMRKSEINSEWFGILIGQLPYTVKSVSATYSEVPDSFRQKFSISITDPFTNISQFSYTAPLPQVIGKRLTLSYIPATVVDQTTIDTYGNIFSTPPYLIKLRPVVKLEGVIIAQGNEVGPGEEQSLTFIFKTPMDTGRVNNTIIAGEYYAIGLNAQMSGEREQILERTEKLKTINETINFNDLSTLDDRLGEILYLSAIVYHQNYNEELRKISSLHKVVDIRQVAEMMYFLRVKVDYLFGIPFMITPISITADMDRDIHLVIPVDGDTNRIKPYMQIIGNHSSYLEHAVTEKAYQTEAISAVKAIQLAHDQGIPVHTITNQNINSELPLLQVSEQVKTDIRNAINAGREAIVPERNVTLYDWNGVGYIIQDPSRGQGAYLISDGFGGSTMVVAAAMTENVMLVSTSTLASQAKGSTRKRLVCFPGEDNLLYTQDDTCYTEVAFRDIKEDCGESDPGCRNKYDVSHPFYAQPLIDFKEHVYFIALSKHITAEDWQSQDNARYMRVGIPVLAVIEALMEMNWATKHNLRPEGSGYRTQDRNKTLRPVSASKSHHMDGVAADIKLAYDSGPVVRKCDVLSAAYQMIRFYGEVLSEKREKPTVHIAVVGRPYNDSPKVSWGCE